jgi:hypothetical protein
MWKKIGASISEWWRSPFTKPIILVGLGGTLYGVLGLFEKLPRLLVGLVAASYGPLVIVVLYVVFLLSISLALFYRSKFKATTGSFLLDVQASLANARSSLADVLKLTRRLFTHHQGTRYRIHAFAWHLDVKDDYSVSQTLQVAVSADATPLFALCIYRGSSNVPVLDYKDLDFHVDVAKGGGDVSWLPSEDNPNRKGFIVFPIPPIGVGDQSREFVITNRWPGVAKKLRDIGSDDTNEYTIPVQAVAPVGEVRLKATVPRNGGRYRVNVQGSPEDLPNAKGALEREVALKNVNPGTVLEVVITRLS